MRIGLLGTGPWAQRVHAPALAGHPEVEFAGVWGRRPAAAAELAQPYGVPVFEDVDELLASVDAVSIALPPAVQAEYAVRAAEAGKHLLLDKSVALTVDQARAVVGAAERAKVASVVFFTLRYHPDIADWLGEQGARDGWFTARAEWFGSVFAPGSGSPYADSPWRREKGALWDVGPHALSVLLPVLGDGEVVSASTGPLDTVHLVIRHAAGALSNLTLSLTMPVAGAVEGVVLELRGEAGRFLMPERHESPQEAYARSVSALLRSAADGTAHPCDAAFGLRVVELLSDAERLMR
ncbi:Gfo/Idh/MocA family oxidoreductase [Kitasatospora albolonga]|uniref:Gfo/Idh/MocA family protein n=1 Tax=Kitasatospora albolonga TaxID=68173 RepID=UPI0031E9419F